MGYLKLFTFGGRLKVAKTFFLVIILIVFSYLFSRHPVETGGFLGFNLGFEEKDFLYELPKTLALSIACMFFAFFIIFDPSPDEEICLQAESPLDIYWKKVFRVLGIGASVLCLGLYFLKDQQWLLLGFWILSLIFCGLLVYRLESKKVAKRTLATASGSQIVLLLLFFILLLILYVVTIDSPAYAARSLEFSFQKAAFDTASNVKSPFFWDHGMYGGLTMLPHGFTLVQAFFVWIFGKDLSSSRLATIVVSLLSIFPLYLLIKTICSSKAAWVSIIVFGFSFLNYQFSHSPFNYVYFFLPLIGSFAFAVIAFKTGSLVSSYLCGVFSCVGWYLNYASLTLPFHAVSVFVLSILVSKDYKLKQSRKKLFSVLLFGILVTALPFITHFDSHFRLYNNFTEYKLDNDSLFEEPVTPLKKFNFFEPTEKRLFNLAFSFFAPLVNHDAELFYFKGFGFDFVSTVLIFWGLLVLLLKLRGSCWWFYQSLILLFAFYLYFLGFLSRYDFPALTRNVYWIPFGAIFAGLGAQFVMERTRRFSQFFFVLMVVSVPILNIWKASSYIKNSDGFFDTTHYAVTATKYGRKVLCVVGDKWEYSKRCGVI